MLKIVNFVLCAVLCLSQAMADTQFKIITLQHRFAEDILPSIQALAGRDGVVTGMQNQLIIRTNAENMAQIEQVVASLDVARQNLKIIVRQQNNVQQNNDNTNLAVNKRFGKVQISNSRQRGKDGVQLNIERNQTISHANANQFINVLDGEQAFIKVGQSVPFTQEWLVLTNRYIHTQKTTEFVDVSTGFAVRARSVGEQIELEITPRIAKLNSNGYIDFEELTTVVRVNHGEWLNLGGIMQQKDEVSRAILSSRVSRQRQDSQLLVCVE